MHATSICSVGNMDNLVTSVFRYQLCQSRVPKGPDIQNYLRLPYLPGLGFQAWGQIFKTTYRFLILWRPRPGARYSKLFTASLSCGEPGLGPDIQNYLRLPYLVETQPWRQLFKTTYGFLSLWRPRPGARYSKLLTASLSCGDPGLGPDIQNYLRLPYLVETQAWGQIFKTTYGFLILWRHRPGARYSKLLTASLSCGDPGLGPDTQNYLRLPYLVETQTWG